MQTPNQIEERIIRRSELCSITGQSYTTIWRRIKAGEFPAPVKLSESGRAVGWYASEVNAYLRNRPRA